MTCRILALAVLLLAPASAGAEWHLKPFVGLTFGGGTTFTADLEFAAGERNLAYGFSGLWLSDVFGVEADFSQAPGFFESGDRSVIQESRVTTVTGSVVVALPQRLTQYTLRPYFAGGLGIIGVHVLDVLRFVPVVENRQLAVTFGGGVTGFFSDRFGVSWDLRHFRRVADEDDLLEAVSDPRNSAGLGTGELSFWRGTTAIVFRF